MASFYIDLNNIWITAHICYSEDDGDKLQVRLIDRLKSHSIMVFASVDINP